MAVVAAVAVAALLAAACGSDDDSTSSDDASTATTAAADTATTAGGDTATTSSDDGSTDTTSSADTATSAPADTGTKEDYKIGYIGPLSGPLGTLGTNQLKALTSLVDLRNESGGVDGHKIVLQSEDDGNDPAKGIAAARALDSDGVIAIVGPPVSGIIDAVLPTTSRARIPMVTVGASPAALNPAQETLFQVDQASASQAQPMVDFAAALLGREDFTVAIGPIDTPSGIAWGENVKTLSETKGFTITNSANLPVAASDITPQAQTLIEGNPDIILVEATDVPYVTFVQKARDLGYEGPIVNFHGGSSAAVFEQLKDENVYAARTYNHYDENATTPGEMEYAAAAQAAGTVENATSASLYGSVYVAGLVVLGALAACGDGCDREGLIAALNSLELDSQGLTPEPLAYTETMHQTMNTDVFWHWDGEKPAAALDGQVFKGSVYSLDEK